MLLKYGECMNVLTIWSLFACGTSEKETDTAQEVDICVRENGTRIRGQTHFECMVYVETTPTGEMTCFADGYTDTWAAQTVDPEAIANVSVSGSVVDFEKEDKVEEANVDIFYSNTLSGDADQSEVSDEDGKISLTVPACSPYTYRVFTDPDLEATKVTIKSSQVEERDATETEYTSVSFATYMVIPALLGISPDEDKGIVAGTAYDCDGEPLEFAQVVVTDAEGNIPDSEVVRYFVDNFPSRDQEWTSEDGLFVVVNIPEGDWTVNMYVSDGAGGHLLMAQSPVKVFADSINISSVYTSFGDGVRYPSSCLASAE